MVAMSAGLATAQTAPQRSPESSKPESKQESKPAANAAALAAHAASLVDSLIESGTDADYRRVITRLGSLMDHVIVTTRPSISASG
jgi:hypothetical protein